MRRLIAILALVLTTATSVQAAPTVEDAAAAGLDWLVLIDGRDYDGSWATASDLFKGGVSQAKWSEMVAGVRDRLGQLSSRKFDAGTLTRSLPGVPDGDYAIIRYQSVFEKKAVAGETVTLILENGSWKAAGYFIK
jgi:hypothetical protein